MPVATATPLTVRYRKIVTWGLAPSAIRFASAALMGHRVAVTIPVDLMNQYFTWTRPSGTLGPIGHFVQDPSGNPYEEFAVVLARALGGGFTDADGVATGLNFSSAALDKNNDIMRDPCVYNCQTDVGAAFQPGQEPDASSSLVTVGAGGEPQSTTHYGANDFVMAWVMFKCFGSSSYDPTDVIYNIDDGYNMLSSEDLAQAIQESLNGEEQKITDASGSGGIVPASQLGLVHDMFLKFLAADPKRYFENGVQIPGLFETNFVCDPSDPEVNGNWCLTVGDRIEVPLRLVFRAPVSVLSVEDTTRLASSATPEKPETVYIEGEAENSPHFDASGAFTGDASGADAYSMANVIPIRLQIVCGPALGASTRSTSQQGSSLPLQVALSNNLVFYTPSNYGSQTAIAVVGAGGQGTLTYDLTLGTNMPPAVTASVLSIDPATGILTFAADATTAALADGVYDVTITVTDSATTPASVSKTIKVALSNGK